MKTIIFILSILFITNSNAQKFDCTSKTTEYQALFKANKSTESYAIWINVIKNCPKENEVVYTDGIQILQNKAVRISYTYVLQELQHKPPHTGNSERYSKGYNYTIILLMYGPSSSYPILR